MHSFSAYTLRQWLHETGWSTDSYGNLTRSSTALLDFPVTQGLSLGVSKAPNRLFANSGTLTAWQSELPAELLAGCVSYITTQPGISVGKSQTARLKDFVDRFHVPALGTSSALSQYQKQQQQQQATSSKDHLLYGSLFIPSPRLDGLCAVRLAPQWLAMLSMISYLPREEVPPATLSGSADASPPEPGPSRYADLSLRLQHQSPHWSSDYSVNFGERMFGARFLRHFEPTSSAATSAGGVQPTPHKLNAAEVESEDVSTSGPGLKGRFSAGAELFFSPSKSAGLSTGVRFATVPDPPSTSTLWTTPSQPPTVITGTCTPLMGHISTAVSSLVSRDLCLASRFDFNVHSFLSELCLGFEWWQRRRNPKRQLAASPQENKELSAQSSPEISASDKSGLSSLFWDATRSMNDADVVSVVKGRFSSNSEVALAWESRLGGCLWTVGVKADLLSRAKPIKSLGVSVQYFSEA